MSEEDTRAGRRAGREGREGRGRKATANKARATSTGEWIAAAASAVVVLAVLGFLVYQALTTPSAPPAIELRVDSIAATGYGFVVEFHAHNHGPATAAGLVVQGTLTDADGTVQTSQATLDYVPARASRSGGLFFTRDPRRYRLELRPLGYDRP